MKYTDLQINQKIDELWGGGGVPDYTTMPAYKLKKASKNGKKFFVPSNEPTPKGVEAVESVFSKSQYAPVAPGGQTSAVPGGQTSPRKAVPNLEQIVTLDDAEYKVIKVSPDKKSFDVVNVKNPKEIHQGILVDKNPFFIEGKSPHKKGSKKYKKHMAAMHAESQEGRWAVYIDGKDTMVRFKSYADAGEMQDKMEAKHPSKKIELKSVGINEEGFPAFSMMTRGVDHNDKTCPVCKGSGNEKSYDELINKPGQVYIEKPKPKCPRCDGTGKKIEEEFGGRFIAQDLNDILRDPLLRLPKNINYNNFLNFMEFAMTDSQYKGMTLEQFGDKLKMIFSQWKANQSFAQADKDREAFKKLDAPITTRTPEGKVPSDADKWFMIESEAKERLSTYPSKYQTTWALKKFKDAGGTWSK